MKGILEFLAKNNRWAIVLIIILLLVGGGIFRFQSNKIKEWKGKHLTEVKLNKALNDTVTYYQNAWGEEVAEKLTIQATVKQLENRNDELTASQKELLARVKEVENDNAVITAALIEARLVIDSLIGTGPVVTTDTTVTFFSEDTATHFQYEIKIGEVKRLSPLIEPTILFKQLEFPNNQFVEFHWKDNKKEGYPIEFSVSNSNPYYKTYNINSYAIPELQKEVINPTGWQKVGVWIKKNGKIIGYVAGGVVVGAGGTYLLMQ